MNASPEESDGACYTAAASISPQARTNLSLLASVLSTAGLIKPGSARSCPRTTSACRRRTRSTSSRVCGLVRSQRLLPGYAGGIAMVSPAWRRTSPTWSRGLIPSRNVSTWSRAPSGPWAKRTRKWPACPSDRLCRGDPVSDRRRTFDSTSDVPRGNPRHHARGLGRHAPALPQQIGPCVRACGGVTARYGSSVRTRSSESRSFSSHPGIQGDLAVHDQALAARRIRSGRQRRKWMSVVHHD